MLDRLEVSKSLTADLEGDGIGGAVNMVMKDAPDRRQVSANFTMGYSAMYFSRRIQFVPYFAHSGQVAQRTSSSRLCRKHYRFHYT